MAPARVVLKASEIAAILGKNQYKPRQEVLDELWKKYSPETFTGKTKRDKAEASLALSDEAQGVLAAAVSIKATNSAQVQTVFNEAREKINSDSKLSADQNYGNATRFLCLD